MNAQQQLQADLAITPKTASLLIRLGYASYRDLRGASPNHVVAQLKALPDMTHSQAEQYRRGLRRMVWLATQDNPREQAKLYPNWTQSALKARGMWRDDVDFDGLSGDEVNQLHRDANG
ncbi:uncharacterized protein Z519_12509 [Cladophialophora bantiana CBS 173.52]|uniref:Uncharacterized protein n=1 Tax=Cladophialophora bantiana (strain ATCC 10958 / CBS 173.52 / CDC B-1940 / NIH 8579) TaxID=1442370 RepID=A0A0D2H0S9_CLAB1|nr:uncharacterized protein Z519_12509 [Cladophialophora bantiana CBS 173.52]KIW86888.1 hypothetical protein Z519_12509 [Cladophialophora bantiana CBS 173.52]